MGDGAKLTLENVTIKNFKQAGIYIGSSDATGESVVLKGTITFDTNVAGAWGGIGVRNGTKLNASAATIVYNGPTVDIYNDATGDSKVDVKPVIWTESAEGGEVTISGYTKHHIYKENQKRIKATDSQAAKQTIFTK